MMGKTVALKIPVEVDRINTAPEVDLSLPQIPKRASRRILGYNQGCRERLPRRQAVGAEWYRRIGVVYDRIIASPTSEADESLYKKMLLFERVMTGEKEKKKMATYGPVVRRRVVEKALLWLKGHNALYANINIDTAEMERWDGAAAWSALSDLGACSCPGSSCCVNI
jgi:hypothetical protein